MLAGTPIQPAVLLARELDGHAVTQPDQATAHDLRGDPAVTAHGLKASGAERLVHLRAGGAGTSALQDDLRTDAKLELGERDQVDARDEQIPPQLAGRDLGVHPRGEDRQVLGLDQRHLTVASNRAGSGDVAAEPAAFERLHLAEHAQLGSVLRPDADPRHRADLRHVQDSIPKRLHLARPLDYAELVVAKLPDIVAPKLDVLIVAINPSLQSAATGHSFSSSGNPFWRLLHEAGLTRVLLRAEEERRLLEFGIGLTSSAVRPTRAASELSKNERLRGAERVERLVAELRPRYVALLGLTLYPVFFPEGAERGPGRKTVRLAGARVFVLPNPSGRNRAYPGFEKKLVWYRALAEVVRGSQGKRA